MHEDLEELIALEKDIRDQDAEMKITHKFTSDEKKEWWGYGEWIEEPDLVEFEHCGLKCKIVRQAHQEPNTEEFHMFGGYLTGYVSVPENHCKYKKEYDDLNFE